GLVSGDVWPKINALPILQHLPQGVQKLNLGNQKWQGELVYYFALALIAGMLFGIVAKNSILLVDFAVEMMNHGMAKDDAIWEAGHKRAQPIIMTTVAMVAGMLPIALSLSGDASWRAPMGVTVIGGLLFSTLLTLLLVPAYFSIAISIESRIGKLFHKVIGTDAHAPGHPVPAE